MAELNPLQFYLVVLKPITVFSGRVNGAPTDPYRDITWDGGATGTASSIGTSGAPVIGNTVEFGTTEGGRERGITRLVSWTPDAGSGSFSGLLVTAENDDVSPNIVDNDYITVKLFWQLWDRVPRQDASDPNNIIFYEDYDIAYNQQTVNWWPMALAGPPAVEFLEAGQATVNFIGDRSYALAPGATLSTYLWTAHGSSEGTSSSQGTEASPVTFTWTSAGQYLISLQVTDSNGNSHTNYTWVFIIDPTDPTAVAYTQFDAISDNFDTSQGGGSCGFTVYGTADTTQFPTESIVLHVARGSITTPTATWPNRSNILYAGWITGDTIRQDPRNDTVSFRTVAIDGLMKKLAIYPVRLEDNSNPQNWTQAKDLTVDRVLSYLAHWRSTLSLMANVRPLNYDAELKSQDFNASNLWGMFKALMGDAWGMPVSDHQSTLNLVRDYNLMTTTERAAATTRKTLHKGLWVSSIDIAERQEYEQPTRKVKWNGVYYPGDSAEAVPYFSEAPGDVMDSWGNEASKSGFILTTQGDLNTRTGHAYARFNQQYPTVTMRFLNDGSFTIAPQEIFPANIEAADNNRGLAWTPNLIPRQIRRSYNHEGGYFEIQVSFEPSVTGPAGQTVTMPSKPASATGGSVAPSGDPPPTPPAWTQPTVLIPGPAVGADTTDGVYWTLTSGASWEARNNLLSNPDQLAFQYLIWDPWWFTTDKQGTNDPEQVILLGCGLGFIVISQDAGKTWADQTNLIGDPTNDWTDDPAPTIADVEIREIHGDIHKKDRFVAIGGISTGVEAETRGWLLISDDNWLSAEWTGISPGIGTDTYDFVTGDEQGWANDAAHSRPFGVFVNGVGWTSVWGTVAATPDERLYLIRDIDDLGGLITAVEVFYTTVGVVGSNPETVILVNDVSMGTQAFTAPDTFTHEEAGLSQAIGASTTVRTSLVGGAGTLNEGDLDATVTKITVTKGGPAIPLSIDVDDETGKRAYITVWNNGNLTLQNWDVTVTTPVINSNFVIGAATLAEIEAQTYYAVPYTPPFFGTADFGDIVYIFGVFPAAGGHIKKSTDGGATFGANLGDGTWGAAVVGAFFAIDSNTFYAFVNGGSRALWRSIDGGSSWSSLSALPFDVAKGGVSLHADGRLLIINQGTGPAMAAYAESPDYGVWFDATGSPSFPTAGGGANAVIWIT